MRATPHKRFAGPPYKYMNALQRAAKSKIVQLNLITTLIEISAIAEGIMPPKYLIYTTTAKSILTMILRVWFSIPNDNPPAKPSPVQPGEKVSF